MNTQLVLVFAAATLVHAGESSAADWEHYSRKTASWELQSGGHETGVLRVQRGAAKRER